MMGKTRIEELCYELYGSSKQHDSWQRYAMVRELRELMKRPKASGSDHFERALNEEELIEVEVATDPIETKHELVSQVADSVSDVLLVHVVDSVSDVLLVPKADSHVMDVEELSQKSTNGYGENVAHQLFDQMPLRIASKEKRRKSLKAWKFKFKTTSKRSKSMDVKFFSVEEIVGIRKDSKEANWGCVNKEFKEVVAGCGKTGDDQFKLVDMNELRSEVLDQIVTFMYQQALDFEFQTSHGFDNFLVPQEHVHVKEMEAPLYPHKSTGNNLHHIAHQLVDKRCLRIHTTIIYYGIMGFVRFLELCYTLNLFVTQDEGFMESFNNLVCSSWIEEQFERRWSKMICRFEHNENDWIHSLVDTSYCEIWPDKTQVELQEMSCFLSEKSLVEFVRYKAHGRELLVVGVEQLTRAATKFYLKHKWRSRLLQSFSRLVVSAWINLLVSKAYEFSRQLQDSSKGEAEIFPLLNFSAGQHPLWMQDNSEPIFIVSELERKKKKLCYRTWMFKYKVDEEDQEEKMLQDLDVQPAVSANQVSAIFQSANAHGMITRGKDGSVKTDLRYSLLAVQRSWEKEIHDVEITEGYYVLQEEFEQIENHTPYSVIKLERPQDHDALLLPLPSDERFHTKHSELLVIVLEWVDTKGGFGLDKKPLHLSLRNRVWDPGGCISGQTTFLLKLKWHC